MNDILKNERTNFRLTIEKNTNEMCRSKTNEKADPTHLYFCLYLKEINYVTLVPCLLSHKSANCLYVYRNMVKFVNL